MAVRPSKALLCLDLISICTSDTFAPMARHGREVASVEAWVRKGIAEGWCKPGRLDLNDRVVPPERFHRSFVADLSMSCEDPYVYEVWGRYNRKCEQTTAIFVHVKTRCRKCAPCLKNKARFWTARAMTEFQRSPATWLVTLTLRPEQHAFYEARMQTPLRRGKKLLRDAVGPLDGLAPATLFALRAREIGYDITLILKRMRKNLGPFRYLLVAERHMGNADGAVYGRPHFHMLVHEMDRALVAPHEWQHEAGLCEADCRKPDGSLIWHSDPGMCHDHAKIRKFWTAGFNSVRRCVDMKSAIYVCKYVSKDPMARVRASIGYGSEDEPQNALPQTSAS